MNSPTRFLVLVVAGWIGVRAVTLGIVPDFESDAAAAAPVLPPPAQTDLLPPQALWQPEPAAYPPSSPAPQPWPYPVPVYRTVIQPVPVRSVRYADARWQPIWSLPPSAAASVPPMASVSGPSQWPEIGASVARRSSPVLAVAPSRFDRFQVATWAMVRDRPGAQSLAGTGSLGGSQAGMRFLYRFSSRLAASVRATAPLNTARRGGDVAAGIRYTPFAGVPLAVTVERRQGFGVMGGPSGFAVLGEGGLFRQWGRFRLDSYLQGGMIVGKDGRLAFVDGGGAVTHALWRNIDVGAGMWGGEQPGLARFDVGPRLSLKVARGIRAHADYRFKVAGNAQPGSGAAITLTGDF